MPKIRYAALFRLKHSPGSAAEAGFLAALADLKAIPGVTAFDITREVSPRNDFDFAVSMQFASQADYESYNSHPAHVAFFETRWKAEVEAFMEQDTLALTDRQAAGPPGFAPMQGMR